MQNNISKSLENQSVVSSKLKIKNDLNFQRILSVPNPTQSCNDWVGSDEGQTLISCPSLLVNHSLDTLHIYFNVNYNFPFDIGSLHTAKSLLQSGSGKESLFSFSGSGSGLFEWNIQRTGIKYFPYVLRTGDLILGLSGRKVDSNIPNMCLMIGSLSCNDDVILLLKKFYDWCDLYGIKIIRENVSRADICSDLKISIKDTGIIRQERHITRSRNFDPNYYCRKLTGCTVGRGGVVSLRVYDKQAEMKKKNSFEKQVFFNDMWGTKFTDDVTRVEFQLRRKALVELLGDNTKVVDIINNMGKMWQYLTKKWFRLAAADVDRESRNQNRSKISKFWEIVQESSVYKYKKIIERKKKVKHIDIPSLVKQAVGLLMSVSAGLGQSFDDYFGIMATVDSIISKEINILLDDPGYRSKFNSKVVGAIVSF